MDDDDDDDDNDDVDNDDSSNDDDIDMCPQILLGNMLAEWRQFERSTKSSFSPFDFDRMIPRVFYYKGSLIQFNTSDRL